MAEYLGATIDIDITEFQNKMDKMVSSLEELDRLGNKHTSEFAKQFKDAIKNADLKPLQQTIGQMEGAMERLGKATHKSTTLTKESFDSVLAAAKKSTDSLKRMIDESVEAERLAINGFLPSNRSIPKTNTTQAAMSIASEQDWLYKQETATDDLATSVERLTEARDKAAESAKAQSSAEREFAEETYTIDESIRNLTETFNSVKFDFFEGGTADLEETKKGIRGVQDEMARISANPDITSEQRQSLKALGTEARITARELSDLDRQQRSAQREMNKAGKLLDEINGMGGGSSAPSSANDATDKKASSFTSLAKALMEAKRLASGSATSITSAVQTISRALKASGIGIAIGAIILYLKGFYDWNKKLLQQNWAGFKDKIEVLRGIKTESQALEDSARRRAKALDEETEALMENIRAEKERKTVREKAETAGERKTAMKEFVDELGNSGEWNFMPEFLQKFFGTYKSYDKEALLSKITGDDNKSALSNFLDLASDTKRIETMTSEEVELAKRDAVWAVQRSEALAKVEAAQKSINTLEEQYAKLHKEAEAEIAKGVRAFDASRDDYEDYNATSQERASATLAVLNNQKKSLEGLKKEYQSILDYQQGILDTETEIESVLNRETFQRRSNDARERIDSRSVTSLGGSEWASDQSAIDEATRSLSKFNDLRAYELNLIKRGEELRKKGVDASATEWKDLKKLEVELSSINRQISYLRSNGVDSETQRDMLSGLEADRAIKSIELENERYKTQSELLQRIADFKISVNNIAGGADAEAENNRILIELEQERYELMSKQKNISDEERHAMAQQVERLRELVSAQKEYENSVRLSAIEREKNLRDMDLDIEESKENARYNQSIRGVTDEDELYRKEMEHEKNLRDIEIERKRVEMDSVEKQIESYRIKINSRLSEEQLLKYEERITELQKKKAEDLTPQEKEELDEIVKLTEEHCEVSEEDLEKYEELNKFLELIKSQINEIISSDPNDIAPNEQAIKRLQKASEIVSDMSEGFGNIADTIENNLGENGVSNVFSGLGSFMDNFGASLDNKAKGEKLKAEGGEYGDAFTSGEKIGAWMQAAEFVADQTTKIVATQRAIEESAEKWRRTVEQVAHEYAMIELSKMEYEQKNIFGVEDPYKKLEDNAKKYAKARELTYDAISKVESQGIIKVGEETKEKWDQIAKDTLIGAGVGAAAGSTAMGVGAAVGAVAGAVTGFVTGLFAEKEVVEVFDTLQNKFGEVFDPETLEINDKILASYDQLDDKTKQLVDNYKELKEEMEEAKEAYMEYAKTMFGDLGGSLADSLVNAFRNDELYNATNDFRDYVKKQMENIISQQVYSKVFGQIFDGIDQRVENALDTRNTADLVGMMSSLPYETEQLVSTYGVLMQQVRDAMGAWDLFDPEETAQEALQGSISSMTEDTAGKLNGNFMGLKLSAMEINESVGEMREIMAGNSSLLSRSLNFLEAIADNTSYCRRLESIENTMNQIQISGLKVI